MFAAFLTALLFAGSGICGQRVAVRFGPLRANVLRLSLAALTLGVLSSLTAHIDFFSRSASRLLISGVVGFGLGDVALFLAYPRLGSRLTLLINLCSAPLFGAAGDWLLLGTLINMKQAVACLVIILGVVIVLTKGIRLPQHESNGFVLGVFFALVAGLGQGLGAALSRYAKSAALIDGIHLNGINEAFVRVLPGLAFALVSLLIGRFLVHHPRPMQTEANERKTRWAWLLGAAVFGPVAGVSCFQWALSSTKSAVVLSIISMTPILIMPLSAYVEKDRPGRIAYVGAAVAVSGVIMLTLMAGA